MKHTISVCDASSFKKIIYIMHVLIICKFLSENNVPWLQANSSYLCLCLVTAEWFILRSYKGASTAQGQVKLINDKVQKVIP